MEIYHQIRAVIFALSALAFFSCFMKSVEKRWNEHGELKKKLRPDIYSKTCEEISERD
jgi:hypothetical protein